MLQKVGRPFGEVNSFHQRESRDSQLAVLIETEYQMFATYMQTEQTEHFANSDRFDVMAKSWYFSCTDDLKRYQK